MLRGKVGGFSEGGHCVFENTSGISWSARGRSGHCSGPEGDRPGSCLGWRWPTAGPPARGRAGGVPAGSAPSSLACNSLACHLSSHTAPRVAHSCMPASLPSEMASTCGLDTLLGGLCEQAPSALSLYCSLAGSVAAWGALAWGWSEVRHRAQEGQSAEPLCPCVSLD